MQANSWHSSLEEVSKLKEAEQLYQRAIQLDPKFSLALANLSILESWIYHTFEPTRCGANWPGVTRNVPSICSRTRPKGISPLAFRSTTGIAITTRRSTELAIAQRAMPKTSQISLVIGAIQRRQGHWAESTANLEKAASLSPNDTWVMLNLAYNYWMLRDYEAANRVVDRGLAIEPRSISLWAMKSGLAIDEKGDFSVAEKSFDVLAQPATKTSGKGSQELSAENRADLALSRANIALMEGQYDKALAALGDAKDEALSGQPGGLFGKRLLTGLVQQKLGRAAEAQAAFTAAKEIASDDVRAAPNDAARHAKLARALAHLGEKEAAIAEAKRATELLPESADAFEGRHNGGVGRGLCSHRRERESD